ncbi:MAG: DUF4174 domain-containing protein [Bacteroidota bacterium]
MNLQAQNLQQHRWKNRLLLIKTESETSAKFQDQLANIKNENQSLAERKLVVYQFTGDNFELTDFREPASNKEGKMSTTLVKKLFRKEATFEVVLIGLDGGIKLRQTEVLPMKDLYAIIDGMPMRRQELSRRSSGY